MAIAVLIVLPPVFSVVLSGIGKIHLDEMLVRATMTSLSVGIASASISLVLGWILAETAARQPSRMLRSMVTLACLAALIMPPAVLATGWFVTLGKFTDVSRYAIFLVIALNALMALPFVWSPLYPAIIESALHCGNFEIAG